MLEKFKGVDIEVKQIRQAAEDICESIADNPSYWESFKYKYLNNAFLTIKILSSVGKKYFLFIPFEIATTISSKNFNPFLMRSIWPKVIGSNVPG